MRHHSSSSGGGGGGGSDKAGRAREAWPPQKGATAHALLADVDAVLKEQRVTATVVCMRSSQSGACVQSSKGAAPGLPHLSSRVLSALVPAKKMAPPAAAALLPVQLRPTSCGRWDEVCVWARDLSLQPALTRCMHRTSATTGSHESALHRSAAASAPPTPTRFTPPITLLSSMSVSCRSAATAAAAKNDKLGTRAARNSDRKPLVHAPPCAVHQLTAAPRHRDHAPCFQRTEGGGGGGRGRPMGWPPRNPPPAPPPFMLTIESPTVTTA